MKKKKVFSLLFLNIMFSICCYSQVVSAPVVEQLLTASLKLDTKKSAKDGAFQSLLKGLEEHGLKITEKTYTQITKIHEALELVNSVILQSKDVIIIKTIIDAISNLFLEATLNVNKHPFVSSVDRRLNYKVNQSIMQGVYDKSKELGNYIKDNKLKLNDFQRLTLIRNLKNKISSKYRQMNYLYRATIFEADKEKRKYERMLIFKEN